MSLPAERASTLEAVSSQRINAGHDGGGGRVSEDLQAATSESEPPERKTHLTDCAVFTLNTRGRITGCNIEGELFSTHRSEELLGRHIFSVFVHNEANRSFLREALRTMGARRRIQGETSMLRRESEPFPAHVSVDSMVGEDGKMLGFVLIACDKSQRKKAEDRLRDSERLLRLLMDGVVDQAICMTDQAGVITDWNLGAQRLTGFHAREVTGKPCQILFDAEELEQRMPGQILARADENGRVEVECTLKRSDGLDFPAELVAEAIHHYDGSLLGFALVLRDISGRRALEKRLKDAQEKIQHGHKVEAIGQLAGGIAHDFNNSLQGIVSSLEMASLHLERGVPKDAHPCVETALDAAVRAGGLTQRLLGLVHRQSPGSRGACVNQVLQPMRDLLARVLGDGISLSVETRDDLPPVACDASQLESAVLNLAINARDAMAGRGHLSISGQLLQFASLRELGVTPGRRIDAYIQITVRDDGPGMSEDVRTRALEPFFTTKPKGEGTGLGLAMVHDLVAQYGGAIDIKSQPGHGTSVSLYLPCGAAKTSDRLQDATALEPDLSGVRILVVENDDIVRRTIAARLRRLGCVVFEAPSGQEALLTMSRSPPLDLLLSDIDLPGIDGYELCREARLLFPQLRVILMTGYADAELLGRDFLDRTTESLLKPFDMGTLLAKVRILLQPGNQPVEDVST